MAETVLEDPHALLVQETFVCALRAGAVPPRCLAAPGLDPALWRQLAAALPA